MNEREKEKYYGNEAFEAIYRKAKTDYAPEQISYAPLDEKTLAERIGAVLRPVYERAIAAVFKGNRRADAELDADALSRGMGSSTFVTDVKRRQDRAAAEDVRELESEYGAVLADQLNTAMEGERARALEVDKFNAQQRAAASEQAFEAARFLYAAYLEAAEAKNQGSGGGKAKTATGTGNPTTSLAQAVAAARGKLDFNANSAATYAYGDSTQAHRVETSDLGRYVKMRSEAKTLTAADRLRKLREDLVK